MKKIITSRIFISCFSITFLLAIVAFIGFTLRDNSANATTIPTTTTTSTTSTTTTTTTTTLPPTLIQPVAVNLPMVGQGISLTIGSHNPNTSLYEQRLSDLKFDPGTVDSTYDQKTNFAVQSLQKLVGLPVNGRLGDAEITALNNFQYPQGYAYPAEPTHFEVNLDKQVGILYKDYQVRLITTVSTGSQKSYTYISDKTNRRVASIANTPTGKFAFYRRAKGWEKSDLGKLYNPVYFKGGIAVHGYTSVPATPASHGCVRIPMYISEYFPSLVENGDAVYVYGSKEVPFVADRVGDVVAPKVTTTTAPTQETLPTTVVEQPTPEPTTVPTIPPTTSTP